MSVMLTHGFVEQGVRAGMQCTLVQLFACKAAWLKTTGSKKPG